MNWLAYVPSALSALSSLTSKSKKNQPPQYQPVQYQSPAQMPAYASLFQGQPYDPSTSQVYQQAQTQLATGGLPPELRAQLLRQAQLEAQNAYNAANQNLTFDEDRAMRSNSERMNKMGLLSSGAHGVTAGLLGEGYARQRGNLAANLQGQLGAASTNLMSQEFAQRDRVMNLLAGIENARQSASLTSRGQLFNLASQDAENQAATQRANSAGQYASQQYAYDQNQAARGNLFSALGSAAGTYGAFRQGGNAAAMDYAYGQGGNGYGALPNNDDDALAFLKAYSQRRTLGRGGR